MPEFLVVSFPHRRQVLINGRHMGSTGDLLELEGGKYIVTLDPADGAEPTDIEIDLADTSALSPERIQFQEV